MNEEEFDDIAKTLQIELNAVRYAVVKEVRIFNCDVAAFREMLGEYIDNLGYGLGQFTRHAEVKKNYDSTLLIVEAIKTRTALLEEGTGFSILTPAEKRFTDRVAVRLAILHMVNIYSDVHDKERTLRAHLKNVVHPFDALSPHRSLQYGDCELEERIKTFLKLVDRGDNPPLLATRNILLSAKNSEEEELFDDDSQAVLDWINDVCVIVFHLIIHILGHQCQ